MPFFIISLIIIRMLIIKVIYLHQQQQQKLKKLIMKKTLDLTSNFKAGLNFNIQVEISENVTIISDANAELIEIIKRTATQNHFSSLENLGSALTHVIERHNDKYKYTPTISFKTGCGGSHIWIHSMHLDKRIVIITKK